MNYESALLGAALLTQGKAIEDLDIIGADFNNPKLGKAYDRMLEMLTAREPLDPITLSAKHSEYLTDVWNWQAECPNPSSSDYYAKQVIEQSVQFGLRTVAHLLTQDLPIEHKIDEARSLLTRLAEKRTPSRVEFVADILDQHIASIQEPRTYLSTPWEKLDVAISGFRAGGFYVLGARPGVGKTVIGLQLAQHLAQSGVVAYFSLEMGKGELMNRLLSATSDVYIGKIDRGELSQTDVSKLTAAKKKIENSKLAIIDSGSLNINEIKAHSRTLKKEGLSAIVIDYLGLIPDTQGRKRYEFITEISMSLKALARDLQIPVIALAQLNREIEGRGNSKPLLSDLRDSGSIEQDADVVILLRRDKFPNDREWEKSLMTMDVAKNRHGMTGEIDLRFHGGVARVDNFHE